MATYAISFEIKYDNADSYGKRYASFMTAVRACATVWTETTSFALVSTTETLDELERRLYITQFSTSMDKMLVIHVSYDGAISRGNITEKGKLTELLPGISHK